MMHKPRHLMPRRWQFQTAAVACLAATMLGLSLLLVPALDGVPTSRLAIGKGVVAEAGTPALTPSAAAPSTRTPTTTASPTPTATASPTPTATASPPAGPSGFNEVTQTVTIGSMVRTYITFNPVQPASAHIPALVVLHGLAVTPDQEANRDGLLGLAAAGAAVVVYPAGYLESWNSGSCCGSAQTAGIDDVDFVATLLRQAAANPQVAGTYLIGYSSGGKAAYRVACTDPSLLTALIAVAAVPGTTCRAGAPVSLLQVAATADPRVSYSSTQATFTLNGFKESTVTTEVATWRSRDGCTTAPTAASAGSLTTQVWGCAAGTRVELATYAGGSHAWPAGSTGTPSGAKVIWQFVTSAP